MIKTEIKPEPLNGKIYISNAIDEDDIDPATKENVERRVSIDDKPLFIFKFRDVKSACEFYLRYKDNPELLLKEYPKFKSEFVIKCLTLCLPKERIWLKDGTIADKNKYNEWLFKLAFKDVFGDKK